MKKLYIASTTAFAGKTAITLGLGMYARRHNQKAGYFKPLRIQGYLPSDLLGDIDQDVLFVQRVFGLQNHSAQMLAPIHVDDTTLAQWIQGESPLQNYWTKLEEAYENIRQDKDLMLVEGGGTLRDGFACGIHILSITERFDLKVLVISQWRGLALTLDDIMASKEVVGDRLLGVVINSVPEDQLPNIKTHFVPFLESNDIAVFGTLPLQSQLRAISIRELCIHLNATIHVGEAFDERLVESLSIGAMSVESAVSFMTSPDNSAIITGNDRIDLQGAALATPSVVALILTGDNTPNPNIVKRAEQAGVAVLSVEQETMHVLEHIEQVFGKTPMGQAEKFNRFQAILAQHFDYERLFKKL